MATVKELQDLICTVRKARGFVTDPLKLHILLTEEVGEIAGELKRLWSKNYDPFDPHKLQEEIADVFVTLSALANVFDIDIEVAVREKFITKDHERQWKSAQTSLEGETARVLEALDKGKP